MCGLVGAVGDLAPFKHRDAVEMMLKLDVLRGEHSTGVATVDKTGEIAVNKKLGNPYELFDSRRYKAAVSRYDLWVMMGHNRYATKGKINSKNAHPFRFNNVVGAHNGTLRDVTNLKEHKAFEVDSEALMYNVELDGVEQVLPKLRGAYALTIYDDRDEAFYLARNDERPLFYCYTTDGKTMFYASEEWMLEVSLSRLKVGYKQIHSLEVGKMLRVERDPVKGIKVFVRNFEVYKAPVIKAVSSSPKPREVVKFTIDGPQKPSYGHSTYLIGTTTCKDEFEVRIYLREGTKMWEKAMNSTQAFEGEVSSVVTMDKKPVRYVLSNTMVEVDYEMNDEPVLYVHPDGSLIGVEEWEKIKDCGCQWCTKAIEEEDAGECGIYLEEIVCPKCAHNLGVAV